MKHSLSLFSLSFVYDLLNEVLNCSFCPFIHTQTNFHHQILSDQLHKAIKHLSQNNGFAELVFYLEACESGSMFKGMLEDDLGVYAITAANERESSWGEYINIFESIN